MEKVKEVSVKEVSVEEYEKLVQIGAELRNIGATTDNLTLLEISTTLREQLDSSITSLDLDVVIFTEDTINTYLKDLHTNK